MCNPLSRVKMNVKELPDLIDSKLAFTTPEGDFEGILKLILIQTERVTFEHVFLLPSRDYLGTMHILFSDITSCRIIEPACKILDVSMFDSSKDLLNGGLKKSNVIDETEIIEIAPGKHFFDYLPSHLKDKSPSDYCIIDSISTTFYRAVNHLSQLSTIGVSFHGPKISRSGNLCWVCISSSACLFMFDVEKLGMEAFNEGLKKMFEDEEIEKVIHNCREAADCLVHKFHIDLRNIFDTQVADFLINMQMFTGKEMFKYVSSLDSCLFKYLKVPQQFLYNRNKCLSFDDEIIFFQERPISAEFTNVLIKSTMYLVLLKEAQENLLLHPFEQAVELYLNVIRTATDSEVFREPTEFSLSAPSYLLGCIKSVRFYETSEAPDDFVNKLKNTLHGQKVWCEKMLKMSKKDSE